MNSAVDAMQFERGTSLWRDAFRRLCRNKLAVAGAVILAVILLACLVAPWFSPYGYEQQDLELGAAPPSAAHWLGTDTLGRDLLTRILYGGRISLMVGLTATFVALLIGVVVAIVLGLAMPNQLYTLIGDNAMTGIEPGVRPLVVGLAIWAVIGLLLGIGLAIRQTDASAGTRAATILGLGLVGAAFGVFTAVRAGA